MVSRNLIFAIGLVLVIAGSIAMYAGQRFNNDFVFFAGSLVFAVGLGTALFAVYLVARGVEEAFGRLLATVKAMGDDVVESYTGK